MRELSGLSFERDRRASSQPGGRQAGRLRGAGRRCRRSLRVARWNAIWSERRSRPGPPRAARPADPRSPAWLRGLQRLRGCDRAPASDFAAAGTADRGTGGRRDPAGGARRIRGGRRRAAAGAVRSAPGSAPDRAEDGGRRDRHSGDRGRGGRARRRHRRERLRPRAACPAAPQMGRRRRRPARAREPPGQVIQARGSGAQGSSNGATPRGRPRREGRQWKRARP